MNGQKNTYKDKERTIRKYISLVNEYTGSDYTLIPG